MPNNGRTERAGGRMHFENSTVDQINHLKAHTKWHSIHLRFIITTYIHSKASLSPQKTTLYPLLAMNSPFSLPQFLTITSLLFIFHSSGFFT